MSDLGHQLSPGFNFNGRYLVSRCIGAGGMGSVYECVHSETHGKCALKVMAPRLVHRDDARRRFLQEARVTAKIPSDHIVSVFDAGVDDATGMPFIVMELLVGEDLDAMLARAGCLAPGAVITLLRQTALALDKTHAAGIVHRDLKPANLFITRRDDGSPCVKILDFGIAKLVDATGGSDRTRSAGTPVYMPPEQVRGDGDIGAAADAYALAQIAYTMLAGRPYWETEAVELGLGPFIQRVFAGPRERPSERAARSGAHLPPSFDDWFARAANVAADARILPTSREIDELASALGLSSMSLSSVSLPPAPTAAPFTPYPASQGSVALTAPPQGPSHAPVAAGALPFTPVHDSARAVPFSPVSATTGAVVSAQRQSAPAGGAKPLWFLVGALVVLGSVAVGSFITYRLVVSDRTERVERDDSDEDDRDKSKKKKKKGPDCLFERCKNIDIDKNEPVEVLQHLPAATALARSVESAVELVMISIGETVDGRVLRDASFSMVFIYRYPKPGGKPGQWAGIQVIVNHQQMMARRATDVGLVPVSPPRCNTQAALAAAFGDGLDKKSPVTVVYSLAPGSSAPTWMISQPGDKPSLRYIDGITCAAFNPF